MPFSGLPEMPAPDGNAFDNYVAAALRAIMHFHEEDQARRIEEQKKADNRKRWIQMNLLAMLGIVLGLVLWYGRASMHMSDAQIHPSPIDRESEFDKRFAVKMEARDYKMEQALENQREMTKRLGSIDQRLEALRELQVMRNRREESFDRGRQ